MTQITTGPDGQPCFDGMTVEEVISFLETAAYELSHTHLPNGAPDLSRAIAALRHLSARVEELEGDADNAWRTAHRWEHDAQSNERRLSAVMDELDRWKHLHEALASSVAKTYSNQPIVHFVADDEATRIRKAHAAAMRGDEL